MGITLDQKNDGRLVLVLDIFWDELSEKIFQARNPLIQWEFWPKFLTINYISISHYRKLWITSKQLSRISTTKGGYCRTQISSSHLWHLYKRRCPKMLEDASLAAGPCLLCIPLCTWLVSMKVNKYTAKILILFYYSIKSVCLMDSKLRGRILA